MVKENTVKTIVKPFREPCARKGQKRNLATPKILEKPKPTLKPSAKVPDLPTIHS